MPAPEGGECVSTQHRHEAVVDRRAVEGATPAAARASGAAAAGCATGTRGAARACRTTGPRGAAGTCGAAGTRCASSATGPRRPSGPACSPVGEADEAGPVGVAGPVACRSIGEDAGLAVIGVVVAVVATAARASRAAGVAGAARATRSCRTATAARPAVDVHADEAVAGCVAGPDAWLAVREGAGQAIVRIVEAGVSASARSRSTAAAGCSARAAGAPSARSFVARAPGVTVGAGLRCWLVAACSESEDCR